MTLSMKSKFKSKTGAVKFVKEVLVSFFITILNGAIIVGCGKNSPPKRNCTNTISESLKKTLLSAKRFSDIFVVSDTLHLETHREALIGTINQACKHPNGYIVLDRFITRLAFRFDSTGKFVKVLGAKGEGPREYREPTFIFVDAEGYTYLLDPSLHKIIKYDTASNFLEEISLRELGIYPSAFTITKDDKNNGQTFIFYNIHPDFSGKSKNKKVIIAKNNSVHLIYKSSFGTPEPLLSKLFYNMGSFNISPTGEIWLGKIFDLDIELYTLDGSQIKTIKDHYNLLPGPHITPKALSQFSRISESLDTYYKLTRFSNLIFLNEIVFGIYFSEKETHVLFFDQCGNVFPKSIIEDKYPLPSVVVGSWDDKFYVQVEAKDIVQKSGEVPNPMLVGYKLR